VPHAVGESSSMSVSGFGSGGYLEYLARAVAEAVLGLDLWGVPLCYSAGRNADYAEVEISSPVLVPVPPIPLASRSSSFSSSSTDTSIHTGLSLSTPTSGLDLVVGGITPIQQQQEQQQQRKSIKFARVYGFRNIQSVLLKLKRRKLDLDFIEVMACPSGCGEYRSAYLLLRFCLLLLIRPLFCF
jgi:hypothetical protein